MSDSLSFVPPITRPSAALPVERNGRIWTRRNLKFAAAFALLGAAGYALLSGQGFVTCDNAVVSAYTFSLRAPISGYVSGLGIKVGDPVAAGATLVHLAENRLDDQRFIDLTNLLTRLRSNRHAYEQERAELATQHDALLARAEARDQSEAVYLRLQAAEAERQIHLQEAVQDLAHRDFARKDTLGQTGYTAAADVDKSRSVAKQADMSVEAATARHAYLRLQAEVANRGVLLESGSADVSYSSQRADELAMKLAEVDREIAYLTASEAETAGRLDAERKHLDMLRSADLIAPSAGMLWKLRVSEGEHTGVGYTVADIIDCRSAFIVAAVPQDRFSDVEIGGAARVRLSGETTDRAGRVVSLTGEVSLTNDRNLAAAPPVQRVATATARIEVAASGNSARECLVGRTARVLLPASPDSGLLAGLARRFF